MVSWYSDGLLGGYSPDTRDYEYAFHFATPGSVDVNAKTRLQWQIDPSYGAAASVATHQFVVQAPITFAQSDITAMQVGTVLAAGISMGLFVVSADHFAPGHVPTPQEIYGLGASKVNISFGDQYWSNIGSTPISHVYGIPMNLVGNAANKKWWLLVSPVKIVNLSGGPTYANIVPFGAVNGDWSSARAISAWVNETPGKPVITSSSGERSPGETYHLSFTTPDPDAAVPDDAQRYNRDLAAVQIQYAPLPSPQNPNPVWKTLPFNVQRWPDSGFGAWNEVAPSEFCRGNGAPGLPVSPHDVRRASILETASLDIFCGYSPSNDSSFTDLTENSPWPEHTAAIPAGEWQIRVRTFDWGHPFPGTVVPPLGVVLTGTTWMILNNFPADNTSPWSDPITLSITAQVPPPVPVSPTQDIAVEASPITRLSWQYLNTHEPPFAQVARTVQMRKVGDPDWKTIFDGLSGKPYVDVPAVFVQPNTPDIDYMQDSGFESGGLDGWGLVLNTNYNHVAGTIANASVAGKAHSGTHYLQMGDNSPDDIFWGSSIEKRVTPDPAHNEFSFDGWFGSINLNDFTLIVCWEDADGNRLLTTPLSLNPSTWSPYEAIYLDTPPTEWTHLVARTIKRHPQGVKLLVQMQGSAQHANEQELVDWRLDDVHLIGRSTSVDDIVLEPTTEYEWRVKTTDSDGKDSVYSEPARFWIVDPATSGPVRPASSAQVEGATLGCGKHRVFVFRRGGQERVGELTQISHVDWSRLRDDMSTAKVVVSGWSEDCGNLLRKLQTWAYELVIFRDNGYSVDRVWEGPITLLTYEVDKVTIDAKDVVAYPYRRIIKQAMSDNKTGDTVVNRAAKVIQNVMAPDDPNVLAYLRPIRKDDDARQYRSTPAYSRTAFEEVDDMAANAGLDYTAIGRSILLWDTSHRIGTLPEFKDDDLGSPPIVSEYGMSMANRYSVSDGNGVHGEAERLDVSGNDPIYGLVEMLSSTWASDSPEDSGTYTQAGLETTRQSFKDFAERSIADRYPPPVVVRVPDNTTLNPKAVVSIQQLVPGVAIPLRSTGTLRPVVATQKLDSIKVVDEDGKETITVTMSPFSRDDAAVGDGEDV